MTYSIRKLAVDDLARFRALLMVFGRAFHDRELRDELPSQDYLRHLLSKRDLHVLVALDGDQVIGGITGYELELCSRAAKEIYIYDLAVDAPYRRQGIARALVSAMQDQAKAGGVSLLFVEAHAEDSEAVAFYQSLGAEMEDVRHFNIDVG